jgi:hypothetical protein
MKKDKKVVKDLSEVVINSSTKIDESFHITHLRGINAAYQYLTEISSYQKDKQSFIKIIFGFILCILSSIILF